MSVSETAGGAGASSVDRFLKRPILNSPYKCPSRHWELDTAGQPTPKIVDGRRPASFLPPMPEPKAPGGEFSLALDEDRGPSAQGQRHLASVIDEVRDGVDAWRRIPNAIDWRVSPETARLLQHWRSHRFSGARPFFCQLEAVETVIWLTEVAPFRKAGRRLLKGVKRVSHEAHPGLSRLALKMATGTGKTTVMAMLIAWQTINAVRRLRSRKFTRGFLVVTPEITIPDRLRVLQPNDTDTYHSDRELVPGDVVPDLARAKIVITNHHALKRRERMKSAEGGCALLQGQGRAPDTTESAGQTIRRVMPELLGIKHVMVLNYEADHCYRKKVVVEGTLDGGDRTDARENRELARLWISGLDAVAQEIGISRVIDLSATPFFLRGAGYAEGTPFPWTVSDFSLMDAIESGVVRLPGTAVADDVFEPESDLATAAVTLFDHVARVTTGDCEALAAEELIQAGGSDPEAEYIPRRRPWG